MRTERKRGYAPLHYLTGLMLLTLAACSPPGPSTDKIRMDIQDVVNEKSKGLLMVADVSIENTETPSEDRLYYNVSTVITVPDGQKPAVDQIANTPYDKPFPGQLPIFGQFRRTWIDVFFNGLGWDGKAVQSFLEGDQKAPIQLRLYYKKEGKDFWVLKSVPKLQNIKLGVFGK